MVRKKFAALEFKDFIKADAVEEKKGNEDEAMADDDFRDVNHMARKSKRNRGATESN